MNFCIQNSGSFKLRKDLQVKQSKNLFIKMNKLSSSSEYEELGKRFLSYKSHRLFLRAFVLQLVRLKLIGSIRQKVAFFQI